MKAKLYLWIALTVAAFVFYRFTARLTRVRAARREWRRMKAVRHAYELSERADRVLGI